MIFLRSNLLRVSPNEYLFTQCSLLTVTQAQELTISDKSSITMTMNRLFRF